MFFFILILSLVPSITQAYKSNIIEDNNPHSRGTTHEDITSECLDFLTNEILHDIIDEHGFVDITTQDNSAYHFGDCDFQGSAQNIIDPYDRAIKDPDPNNQNFYDATDAFSQLLYIVQDFYSHSNWVKLGKLEVVENSFGN